MTIAGFKDVSTMEIHKRHNSCGKRNCKEQHCAEVWWSVYVLDVATQLIRAQALLPTREGRGTPVLAAGFAEAVWEYPFLPRREILGKRGPFLCCGQGFAEAV